MEKQFNLEKAVGEMGEVYGLTGVELTTLYRLVPRLKNVDCQKINRIIDDSITQQAANE